MRLDSTGCSMVGPVWEVEGGKLGGIIPPDRVPERSFHATCRAWMIDIVFLRNTNHGILCVHWKAHNAKLLSKPATSTSAAGGPTGADTLLCTKSGLTSTVRVVIRAISASSKSQRFRADTPWTMARARRSRSLSRSFRRARAPYLSRILRQQGKPLMPA